MIHVSAVLFALFALLSPMDTQAKVQGLAFNEEDPLIAQARLEPVEWFPGQTGQLVIELQLPPKFHAYEDQFRLLILEPDGFLNGALKLTPTVTFFDKFSKKNRTGVEGKSELRVTLEAPPRWVTDTREMKFELTYQACSDTFCLFPKTRTLSTPIVLRTAETSLKAVEPDETRDPNVGLFSQDRLTNLFEQNKLLALFFVFLGGILTSFTPCIFPMIPITLAVLGHESERRSRAQNFGLSVLYVLGIAFTYSILGILAATSGSLFGASLGNPWVLGSICALFLLMSLSMYGLFEIQVPAYLRNSLGNKKLSTGYINAFAAGLIAGVVASPCVGPVLVGILAWVAATGSKLYGFVLLFTYAMGLGLIFLFLGAFSELTRLLPRSGPWLNGVKFVLGSLMLGVFYYYLSLLVPQRWHDGALAFGLIVLGSQYGAFKKAELKYFGAARKGLFQAILLIGFGFMIVSVFDLRPVLSRYHTGPVPVQVAASPMKWQVYSEVSFNAALKEGKPIIIDFWAEWCAACFELEDFTFHDHRVAALSEKFSLFRFDATRDTKELRDLKKRYNIQGLPTVLFFNAKGIWLQDLTLTQFEKADKFLRRMERSL